MASVLREPRSAAGSPRSCWEPDRHPGGHADLSRATQACHGPRGPAGGHADLPLKTRRQHGAPRSTGPPGLGPSDASRCQEPPVRTPGARPHHLPGCDSLPTAPQPSERHSPAPSARTPKLGPDAFLRATSSWGPLALAGALSFAPMPPLSTTYFLRGWNLICHCEPRRAGATPPEESALTDHMPAHGWGPRPGNKQGAPKTAFCLSEDVEETALNVGYGQRSAVTTEVLNAVDSIKNKQNWSLLKTHRSVTG